MSDNGNVAQQNSRERFWIVPGINVVRKVDDRPIMSVLRIDRRMVEHYIGKCQLCAQGAEPDHEEAMEGAVCKNGKLYKSRHLVNGVICQWIDSDSKLQVAMFQIKELKEWEGK